VFSQIPVALLPLRLGDSLWRRSVFHKGPSELRSPTVLLRIRRLLFEECDTSKLCSDHLCRLYPDARELLDPVSNSLQSVERHDVLSAQHGPGS
jgi:hypothetical protein